MTAATTLFVARSDNKKTGDVPTAWIGRSRDESRATCAEVGCPLLASGVCYAQYGTPAMGHSSAIRVADRRLDPDAALAARHKDARMVRVGAIGDPARADRGPLRRFMDGARAIGLAVVGYTHGWRDLEAQDLRSDLMASCDTPKQADLAIATGWRATLFVPKGAEVPKRTAAGHRVVTCPAIATKGRIRCNDCRACDARRPGPVIAFPEH